MLEGTRRRALIIVAALVAALALSAGARAGLASTAADGADSRAELRMWVVDSFGEGLYTPSQIDKVVATAKAGNFNALLAHIVPGADCLCNDSILPRAEIDGLAPEPFDPLGYLIERAHAEGLQVHAWINTTPAFRAAVPGSLPSDPDHVFNRHGPTATGDDYWLTERYDGQTNAANYHYLDVGHPAATEYIVEFFTSIVENYDVDGVNLDRIRQPSHNYPDPAVPSWGYNPVALERFQAATGRDDRPEPGDPEWKQWRRELITSLVRRLYVAVHEADPGIVVSADTIVWGDPPTGEDGWKKSAPYDQALQDWRAWLEEGILDLAMPMLYREQHVDRTRAQFDGWGEYIKDHQYDRAAAVMSGIYLNYVEGSVEQARGALAPSENGNSAFGWAAYSWRVPDVRALEGERSRDDSRTELIHALTQPSAHDPVTPPVFDMPTDPPGMGWLQAPTTGRLSGQVTLHDGTPLDQVTVEATDLRSMRRVSRKVTDGSGWYGFVDLTPGRWRVDIQRPDGTVGRPTRVVSISEGELTTADFTLRAPR